MRADPFYGFTLKPLLALIVVPEFGVSVFSWLNRSEL